MFPPYNMHSHKSKCYDPSAHYEITNICCVPLNDVIQMWFPH
jgi:hypothetical protein